jgi:hypothetical protein
LARSAKHHARLRRLATKPGEKCGLIDALTDLSPPGRGKIRQDFAGISTSKQSAQELLSGRTRKGVQGYIFSVK